MIAVTKSAESPQDGMVVEVVGVMVVVAVVVTVVMMVVTMVYIA